MSVVYPIKLEIEWVAGTWTDVTADVDLDATVTIKAGRTSPLSQPQPSELTFRLDNFDGRYTPGRSTLVDGVTPAPYSPNVLPRRRVRVSYTVAGATRYRFLGFINAFAPVLAGGRTNQTAVTARGMTDRLSRVLMQGPIRQEILADGPLEYWPLTDADGSTSAKEQSGNGFYDMTFDLNGNPQPQFGQSGFGTENGTALRWPNVVTGSAPPRLYAHVTGNVPMRTIELFVSDFTGFTLAGGDNHATLAWWQDVAGNVLELGFTSAFAVGYYENNVLKLNTGVGPGQTLAVTYTGSTVQIWINGNPAGGTYTTSVNASAMRPVVVIGCSNYTTHTPVGFTVGHLSVYTTPLSAGRLLTHAQAITTYQLETPTSRIARFLSYAGLTSADYTLDASTVAGAMYRQPQDGVSVLDGCQVCAVTEGGGAAIYDGPTGLRFVARGARSSTPLMTLDAAADLIADTFTPSTDDLTLINSLIATQSSTSGTKEIFTVQDAASIALYGLFSGSGDFTSYAFYPADVTSAANLIIAANANPKLRIPQLCVDLAQSTTDLWSAAGQVQIGSRLRVSNLPLNAAPSTTVDVYVEGYTETITNGSYRVVYDTSPA